MKDSIFTNMDNISNLLSGAKFTPLILRVPALLASIAQSPHYT